MKFTINSELSLKEFQVWLAQKWEKDKFLEVEVSKQLLTLTQSKSIHLYCGMLAHEFNLRGLDVRETLRQDFNIPWDKEKVKQLIWLELQTKLYGTTSTKKLERQQVSEIFDQINKYVINNFDIVLEFPSKESMNR